MDRIKKIREEIDDWYGFKKDMSVEDIMHDLIYLMDMVDELRGKIDEGEYK